jgi:hypothetical protein
LFELLAVRLHVAQHAIGAVPPFALDAQALAAKQRRDLHASTRRRPLANGAMPDALRHGEPLVRRTLHCVSSSAWR